MQFWWTPRPGADCLRRGLGSGRLSRGCYRYKLTEPSEAENKVLERYDPLRVKGPPVMPPSYSFVQRDQQGSYSACHCCRSPSSCSRAHWMMGVRADSTMAIPRLTVVLAVSVMAIVESARPGFWPALAV